MISINYKNILTDIHANSQFGKRSKLPKHLDKFIQQINPKSIIDFGCGKGRLVERLREDYPNITVDGYDPGNPTYDRSLDNTQVDLLMSSDVLEHVEPEFIDQTLTYLSNKSRYIYHLIALTPAKLILPDGRNAHLILESKEWWQEKFVKLGYKIIKEDYMEHYKIPKGQTTQMLIKKYFIMAERSNGLEV
jgi:cyclopropane fatty-acyl-phospholipid synthase-like methyltransferase